MNNSQKIFAERKRSAIIIMAAGGVIVIIGLLLQFTAIALPFRPQLVGGLGFFIFGWGLAGWIQARAYLSDPKAGQRAINEEKDERNLYIRAKAAEQAYWIMVALALLLLFWLSFSSIGLPQPSDDMLWYVLAGIVVLPFVVFIYKYVNGLK